MTDEKDARTSTRPGHRVVNHKVLRVIVGLIALLLAPVVWLLTPASFEVSSISITYWRDAGDVFVGSLFAVGFFLAAYNGHGEKHDLEYYLGRAACVFAIAVALFPTHGYTPADRAPGWIRGIAGALGTNAATIHYVAAVLLFLTLVALIYIFSMRAKEKGKLERSWLYRTLGGLMIFGIVVGLAGRLIWEFSGKGSFLFWLEAWLLSCFGIGWLVAGCYRTERTPEPETT